MSVDIQSTIDQITSLSVDDRLRVVEAVWDSIGDDLHVAPTAPQREELSRRFAAHEANPSDMLTWDQLLDGLRKKL
jgi:putative addiction module component (TIGR02574 family)